MRELGLDPCARFARVAADEQRGGRLRAVRQRAHERRAEPPDRRRIERIAARPCRARRRCRTAGATRADSVRLPLVIRTCTDAGSMRVTPASREASACTVSEYSPGPSPARSTNATTSSALDPVERLAAAAQRHVDGGRHRLRLERRRRGCADAPGGCAASARAAPAGSAR